MFFINIMTIVVFRLALVVFKITDFISSGNTAVW